MSSPFLKDKNIIDVVKYKWLWVALSAVLIVPGVLAMIYSMATYETHSPMKLGIDFTGGTLVQYGFEKQLKNSDIAIVRESLNKAGIETAVIQVEKANKLLEEQSLKDKEAEPVIENVQKPNELSDNDKATKTEVKPESKQKAETNEGVKTPDVVKPEAKGGIKSIVSIRTRFLDSANTNNEIKKMNTALKQSIGEFVPLQVTSIGPTLGKELFQNAIVALLLAFAAIVIYLTVRFKFDYAMFALVALFHDALFVCGVFAILGLVFNTEIDSLFITAILTVIGFSVHDTIVVFDRVRENSRFLVKKMSFNDIVNASVNQTLARSINTSVTSLVTLMALYFFGGVTTRDFVLAMTLGIAIGTYSSIFNASTLLAMWRSRSAQPKKVAA